MNKKLIFVAAAGALALPGISQAAIDDAGMKYVSAAEGLSGSIRINVLQDSEKDGDEVNVGFSSSRLIYRGSTDLGGGIAATYFFEMRPETKEAADGSNSETFKIKYLDAGIKGVFGHIRVGEIEAVTEAILPNADRSNDFGTSGELLVDDYERGIRWVSPDINGLVLAASAEMRERAVPLPLAGDFCDLNGDGNTDAGETSAAHTHCGVGAGKDEIIDTWDVAVVYSLPMGLALGGSYAVRANEGALAVASVGGGNTANVIRQAEDEAGFRLGAEYEQDNWGIAYNFHSYKASDAHRGVGEGSYGHGNVGVRGHKDTETKEHAFGANIQVNRFNFTFTYGTAEVKNGQLDIDSATNGVQPVSAEFKNTTFDVGYKLGSKSKVVAAFKTDKQEGAGVDAEENKHWYLLYRIDF